VWSRVSDIELLSDSRDILTSARTFRLFNELVISKSPVVLGDFFTSDSIVARVRFGEAGNVRREEIKKKKRWKRRKKEERK